MKNAHAAEPVRLKVGAVLLAAGAGSRLGQRAKSLLELDGAPLIRRIVIALVESAVQPIVVVLGHHADAIAAVVRDLPVQLVRNPTPDDGQASSLRLGLTELRTELDAVIVALADQPLITAGDIGDLISAFTDRSSKQMIVPRVDGKPGNPVILDAALRDEWLAGPAGMTGQQWRRENPGCIGWYDSQNHHYRVDIDTLEDLAQFTASTGLTLRWSSP